MANVQPENGCVAIAHDLYLALMQYDFTSLERRAVDAVMFLTYGAGKAKAEMTTEDIRYVLGADDSLRTDRITYAINKMIDCRVLFRQELVNGNQLLGMQKDYEQWIPTDKMSGLNNYVIKDSNTNTLLRSSSDKMSTPRRLVEYAMLKSKFKHGLASYKAELKQAKRLYLEVIAKTASGPDAFTLICDYIDENDWMRENVRMQFTFMSSRFEAWRSQIPRKPREIREDEEALGRQYRYEVKSKKWVPRDSRKEVQ